MRQLTNAGNQKKRKKKAGLDNGRVGNQGSFDLGLQLDGDSERVYRRRTARSRGRRPGPWLAWLFRCLPHGGVCMTFTEDFEICHLARQFSEPFVISDRRVLLLIKNFQRCAGFW